MAKYRKLPIVIEAEVYHVGLEDGFDQPPDPHPYSPPPKEYWVKLPSGHMGRPYIRGKTLYQPRRLYYLRC